jgi:hypothetical protein
MSSFKQTYNQPNEWFIRTVKDKEILESTRTIGAAKNIKPDCESMVIGKCEIVHKSTLEMEDKGSHN